ncbi:hypothetical protein HPB50_025601 [Hyalomma asiaticum]|uniref:Uncharacterized protein n=1 Tax=Hyalomma asiaticum TaxID=266040 RepID=A0ACB7TBY6_HYAAI|nr:hypothetical protein HPB50_025601 [Hyalomma asiaticum]
MSWADPEPLDFTCEFCGVSFDGEKEFRDHCNSPEHRTVLVSDGGRTWKHRPPPRGILADDLSVCQNHQLYGQCRLGSQCCEAHSEDELVEWRERLQYRRERLRKAQQKHLEGYQEYAKDLLDRYAEAKDPMAMQRVMTETMKGLRLTCKQQLKCTVTSKETALVWEFELCTITPLQRLVLLHDTYRSHFELRRVEKSPFKFVLAPGCQEWVNCLRPPTDKNVLVYHIQVGFQSSMYATFVQTLAFDFGGFPVLIRNFTVDMVAPSMLSTIERSRRLILTGAGRWNVAAIDLVRYTERTSAKAQSLFSMYPAPDMDTFQLTQAVIGEELTCENYRPRMHELLYVEEMARADIIAQYNIRVLLEVTDSMQTSSANSTECHYAQDNELFACLRLDAHITEDTAAGRLVLQNCQLVWLAPVRLASDERSNLAKPRVYELPIMLAKKDRVYIRLTKECVSEFNVKSGNSIEAEVQFLLDRLPLCEMHYAVDKLPMASLVFPDFSVRPPQCPPEQSLNWDLRLNEQQRRAVAAIVAPRTVPNVPPILVVGPFGTGKTFTLAKAMLEVIKRMPDSRVLICTHSNRSVPSMRSLVYEAKRIGGIARWVGILYEYRLPSRVDRRLLHYCLEPTTVEIEAHRVVVTTLSSSQMLLASNVKKGFFTHIFIDEAAQAMETECILPLALADEYTRIVLAGDYMQLNPEVFSVFTRERRLHVSLLERLHGAFQCATRRSRDTQHPCLVVLEENYRSHEALVRFTSESFYGGKLRAVGSPGPHHLLQALSFFAARGEDLPRDGSTSYVNEMEVLEVCDVVRRLVEQWPMTWGPRDPSSVAVLTPYYDQVQCIRTELRNHKLSQVRVESVANVQGKEFRAVVLSTVRTRATCVPLEKATPFRTALNFGFLSDAKLLNTALTRAQSLVVVVGDPVSLCSIGDCRTLWEKFVSTCAQRGSLYNMHWGDIKYQLEGFELRKEYGLNPHAKCFWPKRPFLDKMPVLDAELPAQPTAAPGLRGPPGLGYPVRPPPVMKRYVPEIDRRLFSGQATACCPPSQSGVANPGWWQVVLQGQRFQNQHIMDRMFYPQSLQAQAQMQQQQQYQQVWQPYAQRMPTRFAAQYQHFPPAQGWPASQPSCHDRPDDWPSFAPRMPPQQAPQQQVSGQGSGWKHVGANKPTTNGTVSETRLPRKKKAVAPRFAVLQSRPTSQLSSQSERPAKVPSNGVVGGESCASASRTSAQCQQTSQQAWSDVRKHNSGAQNCTTQVKSKVFKNSAWPVGQNRPAQSQEAKEKVRPTVAYVAPGQEPILWDNRPFDETRSPPENCMSSSRGTINNINFGLDLYKTLTCEDRESAERYKGATTPTDTVKALSGQAAFTQGSYEWPNTDDRARRQQTTAAAVVPSSSSTASSSGSKYGPIGSKPPDKPKLSYSDALRNGHVNGFVAHNASKH